MKLTAIFISLTLLSSIASAIEVSIPTITSPANDAKHIFADTPFMTSDASTFVTGSPETTSPAAIIKTEYMISSESYFPGRILGGATGYSNFSTAGHSQYQDVEMHKDGNIMIDGKRISTLRVYAAPKVEFLTLDGEVVGSAHATVSDLAHMTNLHSSAIIYKRYYTNGAYFSWQVKNSPSSPVSFEGALEFQISENRVSWVLSQLGDSSDALHQAFHAVETGEVGFEFDINGIRKEKYLTMKEIAANNEAGLGDYPQISTELEESKNTGDIRLVSFFLSSPNILDESEITFHSFPTTSSTMPPNSFSFPERYSISARHFAMSDGVEISSNWASGSAFITETDIRVELTPLNDIDSVDIAVGETATIKFIAKNVGQVDAKDAYLSFQLSRFSSFSQSDENAIEDYHNVIMKLSSSDPDVISPTGAYNNNGLLSKSFSFDSFPVGSSKEVEVAITMDEKQKFSIEELRLNACSQYYCDENNAVIKICADGVCPVSYNDYGSDNSSDDSGGSTGYFFLLLVGVAGFALRSNKKSKNA